MTNRIIINANLDCHSVSNMRFVLQKKSNLGIYELKVLSKDAWKDRDIHDIDNLGNIIKIFNEAKLESMHAEIDVHCNHHQINKNKFFTESETKNEHNFNEALENTLNEITEQLVDEVMEFKFEILVKGKDDASHKISGRVGGSSRKSHTNLKSEYHESVGTSICSPGREKEYFKHVLRWMYRENTDELIDPFQL